MVPTDWTNVDSQSIQQIKYDHEARELHVKYRDSGKVYAYSDVSHEEAEDIYHAPSPGGMMRKKMVGLKPTRRL